MRSSNLSSRPDHAVRGFTLLEILFAIAIFGLVITAIYSLYGKMQETTSNQEEIVDNQQNLRLAMDFLARDISMAGAIIYRNVPGIGAGSDATTLNLNTASTLNAFALVSSDLEIASGTAQTSAQDFVVLVPEMVDRFESGDNVRLYRPQSGEQPYSAQPLTVTSVDRTNRTISIAGFAAPSEPVQYRAGDVIVRVGAGAPDPSTISWTLTGTDLTRATNGGAAATVASNISSISFSYLLDDGSEVTTPDTSQLSQVTAVRITIVATTTGQRDGVARQRSLSNVIHLRNH